MKKTSFYEQILFSLKQIPFWRGPLSTLKKIPLLVKKITFWIAPQKEIKIQARVFFKLFFQSFSTTFYKFLQVGSFETTTPVDDSLLLVSRMGAWYLLIAQNASVECGGQDAARSLQEQ